MAFLLRSLFLFIATELFLNSNHHAFASIAPRSYFSSNAHTSQPPSDPVIFDAANFAVDQLKDLSDSGIYTTLSLVKIHEAATELGDFHYVIHLKVALASPYFQSKQDVEDFEVMVLESKPRVEERASGNFNASRSIAIDEFPVMDEDAIERFWVQKVEERRRRRWELFEKWKREGEVEDEQQVEPKQSEHVDPTKAKPAKSPREIQKQMLTLEELHAMPTKQLRQLLTTPESTTQLRAAISAILDDRLTLLEQREEAPYMPGKPQQEAPKLTLHRDEL
ncbi:hypothetical protein JM18_009180 [Phytophthora kernoviae]|uniref:Cysteine proteinase inhibitor n=1 Tax=Phytophthora kernoviae TaxID=325452 RepID=A0A921S8P3_9STRA|nr:hypothetical protein JM18_009180 [Phytophthora kernoviae]